MNPAQTNPPNPYHQAETSSTADVQQFESECLPPDHPEVQARLRNPRPGKTEDTEKEKER